jgi:tetratricopeptide (TPR) repeat protein
MTETNRADRASSSTTTAILVAIGVVSVIAAGYVVIRVILAARRLKAHDDAAPAHVALFMAPAPMPTGLPLIGEVGARSPDGRSAQYVDKLGLRSLLWHDAFEPLTRALESFQDAFEKDPAFEYWPLDGGDAFSSTEPELQAALDAWVKASPASFAPYLVRGLYWTNVAYERRGAKHAADTPSESIDAMRAAFAQAKPDLDRALELRPKLVAAMRQQLRATRSVGTREDAAAIVKRALEVCPTCYQVRVTYLIDLTPRWGGSYDAMLEFARGFPATGTRLGALLGFVDYDKADTLFREGKNADARVAVDRAIAFGEDWKYLLLRAQIEAFVKDEASALRDLDRAAEIRPQEPSILVERSGSRMRLKRWEEAGNDLLLALAITPTDPPGLKDISYAVTGLVHDGVEAARAGRREEGLRLLDLAIQLDPGNADAHHWRSTAIVGDDTKDPDAAITRLDQAHAKSPDDFLTILELDYLLSTKARFDRIAELWSDYIARHPDDGRAFLERSGTYHNLGKAGESRADAVKACELGRDEGCLRAGLRHAPR